MQKSIENSPRRRKKKVNKLYQLIKHKSTYHKANGEDNIFLFSSPRSGSTWLAEIIAAQPGFKMVKEPLNVRNHVFSEFTGIMNWNEVLNPDNREKYRPYIQWFIDGNDNDLRLKRPAPFSDFWNLRTHRILFKILFGGEDHIEWYEEAFGGRYIFLTRHPIPVSISRDVCPRLESFITSGYLSQFTTEQQDQAVKIYESGTAFEKAILDWVFQNALPFISFEKKKKDWILVSYEQMVLEPFLVINTIADRFGFVHKDLMESRINKASASSRKSAGDSQKVLFDEKKIQEKKRWLVEKWKEKVSPEQAESTFNILDIFEIDHYHRDSFELNKKYQIG